MTENMDALQELQPRYTAKHNESAREYVEALQQSFDLLNRSSETEVPRSRENVDAALNNIVKSFSTSKGKWFYHYCEGLF